MVVSPQQRSFVFVVLYVGSGAMLLFSLALGVMGVAEHYLMQRIPFRDETELILAGAMTLFYFALWASQAEQNLAQKFEDEELQERLDRLHFCLWARGFAIVLGGFMFLSIWNVGEPWDSIGRAVLSCAVMLLIFLKSSEYVEREWVKI